MKNSHEIFRHRPFLLYQGARFLSTIAIQMQSVAIGWQVYELTHQPLNLGYVGLATFLPFVLFSLISGDVADRVNRKVILLAFQAALASCAALLLWLGQRPEPTMAPIYGVLALFGMARAFGGPAASALLPHVAPPGTFSRAVAWSSSIWQIASIAGPALGGALFGIGGAPLVFGTCVVFYAASFGLTWWLEVHGSPSRDHKAGHTIERLAAGLRFVWSQKIVLGAISLDLFAVLFGGAVALLPIFARDILNVGPWGLGLMRSAPAGGAALVALVLAYKPLRQRVGLKLLASVALFGIATIVFALSTNFALSMACLVIIGAADMVSVVIRQTLVQVGTPDAMRGRVSAVNQVFIGASNELGEFESGLTAAWFGTVPAVVLGGLGTCLVVLSWTRLFPALVRVDHLESPGT